MVTVVLAAKIDSSASIVNEEVGRYLGTRPVCLFVCFVFVWVCGSSLEHVWVVLLRVMTCFVYRGVVLQQHSARRESDESDDEF